MQEANAQAVKLADIEIRPILNLEVCVGGVGAQRRCGSRGGSGDAWGTRAVQLPIGRMHCNPRRRRPVSPHPHAHNTHTQAQTHTHAHTHPSSLPPPQGLVEPEVPASAAAFVFGIFDQKGKLQYVGFSKDLRNSLRTLLSRRPEKAVSYK